MASAAWPDLGALELLVQIGATGSLGEAGKATGMAQPNASRTIRRLERELGLTLVHRSTRGSRLTENGALLAEWASRILDPAREFQANAAALRATDQARLSLGASRTIAEYAVPGWLGTLRRMDPEVEVTLEVSNSAVIADRVRAGTYDVGFVEGPQQPPGLRSLVVATDRLVLIVAPGHPWARRRDGVSAAELAGTPLVVREPGSGTRTTYEHALRAAGHGDQIAAPALELASNEAVRISVAAGVAPAVLSELAVAHGIETGQVVRVNLPDLALGRQLRVIWRGPHRLTGAAADIVRIARYHGDG